MQEREEKNMGKKFEGVGDFTIQGNDIDIDGVTSLDGGEFNRVTIDGVVSVKSDIQANKMEIDGVFSSSSNVTVNHLELDGVGNFKGNLRCHTADIDGVINLRDGKLEADMLNCDGVLKAEGEVNVDKITADGCISAKEIYGDDIRICSPPNHAHGILAGIGNFLRSINLNNNLEKLKNTRGSKIGILEATKVVLEYTEVQSLCGTDVTIGEGCYVENVDCDGTLRISQHARVRNISGNPEVIWFD